MPVQHGTNALSRTQRVPVVGSAVHGMAQNAVENPRFFRACEGGEICPISFLPDRAKPHSGISNTAPGKTKGPNRAFLLEIGEQRLQVIR